MACDCCTDPEPPKFKGKKTEATGASVEVLIPNVQVGCGFDFMLSSIEEERGEKEPEKQPSEAISVNEMQPGERSSAWATQLADVDSEQKANCYRTAKSNAQLVVAQSKCK